jgi:hypothetical protein
MLRIFRWVLLIPAAVAAWFVALFLGIALLGVLARQVVSGMCMAPWYDGASAVIVAFGAAMAAVFIMMACTAIAPTHKRVASVVTFACGVLVAAAMGIPSGEYAALVAAVVAGAVALWMLLRRIPAPAR